MKYKPHTYKPEIMVSINNFLFKDAYYRSKKSDKLTSKQFWAFKIVHLIGKNAVEIELSDDPKTHNVGNVIHTVQYNEKPSDIAALKP